MCRCLLVVVWCLMRSVSCSWSVARCMLFAVFGDCGLSIVCCLLAVVCCLCLLIVVVRCSLLVVCCLLFVVG